MFYIFRGFNQVSAFICLLVSLWVHQTCTLILLYNCSDKSLWHALAWKNRFCYLWKIKNYVTTFNSYILTPLFIEFLFKFQVQPPIGWEVKRGVNGVCPRGLVIYVTYISREYIGIWFGGTDDLHLMIFLGIGCSFFPYVSKSDLRKIL